MNSLFVVTKPNLMGMAKTRLARDIGVVEARRINAMAMSSVMKAVVDPRWQTALYVTPDNALYQRQPSWPDTLTRISQGSGDLGARLSRAYALAPLGKVVFIGTDMPDLSRKDLAKAFRFLNQADCVVGPADDGGFWLIGLNKRVGSAPPFANVRWSSSETLKDVRANLGSAKIQYLETRIDIDDAASLNAWRRKSD